MSSSEGSLEEVDRMPLAACPEWEDVQPLEVDDGRKVVAIQYTSRHAEAIAYFRAILEKGEKSKRALALTEEMISHNQADYTAWQWRWVCLLALGQGIDQEYTFTDAIMQSNAKNYQLWNHRRKCALALGPASAERELAVAGHALFEDEKNYHAWSHRQAIVRAFGKHPGYAHLWDIELGYADSLINHDVRNNSAWNERAFVLRHKLEEQLSEWEILAPEEQQRQQHPVRALLANELQYVHHQMAKAPRNESVWNYLQGLFRLPGLPPHSMGAEDEVHTLCCAVLRTCPGSPPALDTLAQFYLHCAHLAAAQLYASTASPGAAAAAGAGESGTGASQPEAVGGGPSPDGASVGGGGGGGTQHNAPQQQQQQQEGGGGDVSAGAESSQSSSPFSPEEAARGAVSKALQAAVALLNHLLVADPIRSMYWVHRWRELEALRAATGVPSSEVAGPPAFS